VQVVEITGIAGSGKSYILSQLKGLNIIEHSHLNDFKLFYLFFQCKSSSKILRIIFNIAFKLDFSFYDKLNFIRNSIKKVGKNYYYKKVQKSSDSLVVVDEGISHLYQNIVSVHSSKLNKDLTSLIDSLIDLVDKPDKIIIIMSSQEKVLTRLKQRGHKRVTNNIELYEFTKNSLENMEICKKYFQNKYEIFDNSSDGFTEEQYSGF